MIGIRAGTCLLLLAAPAVAQGRFVQLARQHFPLEAIDADRSSLVDLDGDGDLDVVSTYASSAGSVRVYRNDGRGRFVLDPAFAPFALQTSHVVGDVDGDGDDDVVLRGQLLENRGAAGLLAVPIAIGEEPRQIGDLDGDGRADVLTARRNGLYPPYTTTITAWLAGPGFAFTPLLLLTMPQAFGALALADVDGDGDRDVLVGGSPEGVFTASYVAGIERVLRNDGNGVFVDVPAWWPGPVDDNTYAIVTADLDGDGDVDCATYGSPLLGPSVWSFRRNDGTGRLLPWAGPFVAGVTSGYDHHLLADLDGDGAMDFVRRGEWWRNDGVGGFSLHALDGSPGRALHAVGDVDGDGDNDLLFGGYGANGSAFRLLLDQGGQTFVDATAYAWEPSGYDAAAGDVDGDGDLDLLRRGGPLYRNDGSGRFTAEPVPWVGNGYFMRHHLADVDGDGDLDVLYSTVPGPTELRLLLNDGTGTFTDPAPAVPPVALSAWPSASAVLDADGDGDVDVVFGTLGQGLQLFRNDGALGFTPDPLAFAAFPEDFRVLLAADLDGDGDTDLLSGRMFTASQPVSVRMLVNDGQGHFTDTPSRLAVSQNGLFPYTIDAFDADSDGDLDVLIGNFASSSYDFRHRFWRNDGTGRLVENASVLPDMRSGSLAAVGDFDADGDPDIVATTWFAGVRHWCNNGQGVFLDAGESVVPTYDVAMALADLDGDDDADLIVGDRILHSRQWHAAAPYLPQPGRTYEVEFSSLEVPVGFAAPLFSTGRAHLPLPPFGTVGIDLATAVPLRLQPVQGVGTYTIALPASPALLGLGFGIQAVMLGGARLHLTPPVYDVIRS